MAAEKPTLLYDGFDVLTGGFDSGIAPVSLKKGQFAYGTNTTVRGGYITHRPPFNLINLLPIGGVDLADELFQGACYYKPDFGSESMIAQIGGRLYQFLPDTTGNAFVYDRTAKLYSGGATSESFNIQTQYQYSLVLENLSDTSTSQYPQGTKLMSSPSFVGALSSSISIPVGSGGPVTYYYSATLDLNPGFSVSIGQYVFVGTNQGHWKVTGISAGVSINVSLATTQYNGTLNFPAGTPIKLVNGSGNPTTVGVLANPFTPPSVGSNVTIDTVAEYPGDSGDGITIGGGLYQVVSIPAPTVLSATVTSETINTTPVTFTYDTNPPNMTPAWLWQSENYVIVDNGFNRPLFWDGVLTRRSITPTFVGSSAQPFIVPQIGESVSITLNSPFLDAVGTFINVAPLGMFNFLMQVNSITGNVITATNVTGQTATNASVPAGTPLNSTSSPSYFGVLLSSIGSPEEGGVPAIGNQITVAVSPPFNGSVGDTIIFTDGTGSLTSYSFTVAVISGGGAGLTLTNVNAPQNTLLNVGYPIISQNTVNNELPPGCMGAYVQGRNWIALPGRTAFIASDQVGDSSGTAALFYRDAVLKWTLNTTEFPIPGDAGIINCIVALSTLDASLGQGALQVLCDNDIFTCSAPSDATTWAQLSTPILSESIIGFGGTGQNAAAVINGDLLLKSNDGTFHSLQLSRDDFNQWGNLPISKELNRILLQENDDLIGFITLDEFDNRCLMSCCPIDSGGGVFSQALIALDFDVTSGLQGKLPSVYDGVWTDINVLQLVSGVFNGVNRNFAFCWNTDTAVVELVEILTQGNFDNGDEPIDWSFEAPVVFQDVKGKGSLDLCRLEAGEIYLSDVVGSVEIKVWYRPDYDQCWHVWNTLTVCADNLTGGNSQYRMRVGLGKPPDSECDPTVNKKPMDGRFFQTRFEVTGHCVFMGALFGASLQPQTLFPEPFQSEGVPAVATPLLPRPPIIIAPTQFYVQAFAGSGPPGNRLPEYGAGYYFNYAGPSTSDWNPSSGSFEGYAPPVGGVPVISNGVQAFAGSGNPTFQRPANNAGTYFDYTNLRVWDWNPSTNCWNGLSGSGTGAIVPSLGVQYFSGNTAPSATLVPANGAGMYFNYLTLSRYNWNPLTKKWV